MKYIKIKHLIQYHRRPHQRPLYCTDLSTHLEQSQAPKSWKKIKGAALPQRNILPGFQSVSSTPVFQFGLLPLCVLAEVWNYNPLILWRRLWALRTSYAIFVSSHVALFFSSLQEPGQTLSRTGIVAHAQESPPCLLSSAPTSPARHEICNNYAYSSRARDKMGHVWFFSSPSPDWAMQSKRYSTA